MSHNYLVEALNPATVPQSEPLPGKPQVKNSAGGFVFQVTNWTRLERFLCLGAEGGSYYATERDLTKTNIDGLKAALAEDGKKFVDTVAQISHAGRAPKNDPALFALALAVADKRKDVSAYALSKLPDVARIPTHLFSFAQYVQSLRGWGRALRSGVADWYLSKPAEKLAYQLAKYQSRNGWSNADLLRLSHANPELQPNHKILLNWAVKGWESVGDAPHPSKAILPVWAFEKAKRLTPQTGVKELVRLIAEYDLPRECIPTEFLSQVEVWEALLQKMPMTAMIRNLGKMTSIGLVSPNSDAAKMVGKRLEDSELLHKARIHPISVLMAQSVYKSGHGMKGNLSWSPVPRVVNALEKAFYASFANAPKTGKRFYIGLDVSGSMGSGNVAGTPLTPREAAAAMAMVTMKTEDEYYIAGFTNGTSSCMWSNRGYGSGVTKLELTPDMTLEAACRYTAGLPFGGTDCALPMLDAAAKNIPADVFMVITDSETWAGSTHPTVALQQYRNKMKIDAKLIVMGVVANEFTIADPTDAGQMDVVGFDSAVPQVIAQFIGVDEPAVIEED
jgi:60 kDa SS-A/Ro ribonucleoprotein